MQYFRFSLDICRRKTIHLQYLCTFTKGVFMNTLFVLAMVGLGCKKPLPPTPVVPQKAEPVVEKEPPKTSNDD